MLNPNSRRYFLVESGDILAKATKYREDYNHAHKALWDYIQSIGGKAYTLANDGGIRDVRFDGKAPVGFKASDNKRGLFRPRFKSQAAKDIAALPRMPRVQDALADVKMLLDVAFRPEPDAPECLVPIGDTELPPATIDWYSKDGPLLVMIPDQCLTCAALKRRYPDVVFVNNEDKHDPVTTGMKEILLEEWDLMEARHKRGMKA